MLKQTLLAWLFTNNFQCPRGKKSLVNSNFHATLALSSQGEKETEHFLSRRKRFLMMMEKLFHARSVVAAAVSCLTKK